MIKVTKLCELVVDSWAGFLLAERACMLFPDHIRLAGYVYDSAFVQSAKRAVVLTYTPQLLNDDLDMTASDDVLLYGRV